MQRLIIGPLFYVPYKNNRYALNVCTPNLDDSQLGAIQCCRSGNTSALLWGVKARHTDYVRHRVSRKETTVQYGV